MAAYTWTNVLQVIVVAFWFAALLMWTVSTPALDYCAYEDDTEKLLTDDAARTACEAEIAMGNTGCIKDFYRSRAWKTWKWYVLYFTVTWVVFETFWIALYLMFQYMGITWFVMAIPLVLGFIWLTVVVIVTAIWWVDCDKYAFCSNAKFVYDWTDTVKQGTAWAWIVHMVALYVMWFAHLAFFIVSIANQACLSRAVAESATFERADFLNPLFKPQDRRRIREANAMTDGGALIGASVNTPAPNSVRERLLKGN